MLRCIKEMGLTVCFNILQAREKELRLTIANLEKLIEELRALLALKDCEILALREKLRVEVGTLSFHYIANQSDCKCGIQLFDIQISMGFPFSRLQTLLLTH